MKILHKKKNPKLIWLSSVEKQKDKFDTALFHWMNVLISKKKNSTKVKKKKKVL